MELYGVIWGSMAIIVPEITCTCDPGGLAVGIVIDYGVDVVALLVHILGCHALILAVDKEGEGAIMGEPHPQPVAVSQVVQVHAPVVLLREALGEAVVQLVRTPNAMVDALG